MNHANYMDGVPVKIAEKYKPPPPIYQLPQPLANKLNLEEDFYWKCPAFYYDLQLEKKALSKIEQWKRIRQRNKEQRKERMLKREEQRQQEYEDRQKKLLYSVSYPSTDDLSSGEEDDKTERGLNNDNVSGISKSEETAPRLCITEPMSSFHNILQPTVLSFDGSSTNNALTSKMKTTFDNKMSSFNYKDFEDDTSSPFDNIELKTINDLDVLAQILHKTQINSPAVENVAVVPCDKVSESPNCVPERENKEQFHTDSLIVAENIPKPSNNLPRFSHYFNSPQEALTQLRDHHLISSSTMHYQANLPPSSPHHLYNGCYDYESEYFNQITNKIDSDNPQQFVNQQTLTEDQITKSKSVPDILKELTDEIQRSEIRRFNNCSYNMENTTEHTDDFATKETTVKTNDVDNEDIFNQLSSKAKQLVKQISAMGFPSNRVARIVQLLGTDDKKVVEHLIPLSELADLGFEESKISDALIRNENNKNKALEELISL